MGTILFWSAWAGIFGLYAVTTRRQRQRWFWLGALAVVCIILLASASRFLRQGYITYL